MRLIERYIYTATKHLNEKERIEIEAGIQETINDMLPDDYTEEDVRNVLYKLGNPTQLAEKYQDKPRYLIGPALYNNYIYVLKLVLIIVLSVAPVAAVLTILTEVKIEGVNQFLIQIITQIILFLTEGAVQAFTWVTIIFVVMDRVKNSYMRWPYTGKEWTVDDLLDAPLTKKNRIEKSDPVFSIIFIMIFTIMICFFPKYLGWYEYKNNLWSINPIFNIEVLSKFVPFFVAVSIIGIITAIVKLICQRWTKGLAILNTVYNLINIVVTSAFLLNKNIFNYSFLQVLANNVSADLNKLTEVWTYGILIITVFIIAATGIWECIQGFRKMK